MISVLAVIDVSNCGVWRSHATVGWGGGLGLARRAAWSEPCLVNTIIPSIRTELTK